MDESVFTRLSLTQGHFFMNDAISNINPFRESFVQLISSCQHVEEIFFLFLWILIYGLQFISKFFLTHFIWSFSNPSISNINLQGNWDAVFDLSICKRNVNKRVWEMSWTLGKRVNNRKSRGGRFVRLEMRSVGIEPTNPRACFHLVTKLSLTIGRAINVTNSGTAGCDKGCRAQLWETNWL